MTNTNEQYLDWASHLYLLMGVVFTFSLLEQGESAIALAVMALSSVTWFMFHDVFGGEDPA